MLNACGLIRSTLCAVALASASGAFAAETGIIGSGTFKPPAPASALASGSPFSAQDLASGQISFAARWDVLSPDRDADPYRGFYPGSISRLTVRIGATEISLPTDDTSVEVSDGAGNGPHREFVRLQASQLIGEYRLSVGWMTLNEVTKTGDLRGAAGLLSSDVLLNGVTLAGLQPEGRFDRSLFVILRSETDPRRFPIYLQTSAVEIKPAPSTASFAR